MVYRGERFKFKKLERIGKGGNGEVYNIKIEGLSDGKDYVAKFLNKKFLNMKNGRNKDRYVRFRHEVETVTKLSAKIEGILPIIDSNIPLEPNEKNPPWYIMPKAIDFKQELENRNLGIMEKMEVARRIGKTIGDLHSKGYAHRDIKLENLLIYEEKVVLSDFGLVWSEEYDGLTRLKEKVGPWNTIAPEMKRDAADVKNPKPSDIYSFAKLVWIILKEDNSCFEGQYSKYKSFKLDCKDYKIKKENGKREKIGTLNQIHELIEKSTSDSPNERPTIEACIKLIDRWFEIISDETLLNIEKEKEIKERIDRKLKPDVKIYENSEKILEIIGDFKEIYSISTRRMGVIRLRDLSKSVIEDCIAIKNRSYTYILKLLKLIVEKNDDNEVYYLETEDISDEELSNIYKEYIRERDMSRMDIALIKGESEFSEIIILEGDYRMELVLNQ